MKNNTKPQKKLGEIFEAVRLKLGLNKQEMNTLLGFKNSSSYSAIVNSQNDDIGIGASKLIALYERGVSAEFLLAGKGEIMQADKPSQKNNEALQTEVIRLQAQVDLLKDLLVKKL